MGKILQMDGGNGEEREQEREVKKKFCPFLSTAVVATARSEGGLAIPGAPAGMPIVAGAQVVPVPCQQYQWPCALWSEEHGCCSLSAGL